MEVGLVRKVDIDREMQQSYLDFAMSVIVARALPDARDGLKPVQRRILYAMYDMGLRPESAYKKSARIVGEVLGKYHPHGDMAVYEAMARLAQDFSMRYPLVDGQGNFGSVDGDPPAAMRYTEARLKPFAIDLLAQLERDTVNFSPNFDDSLSEPEVLPAAIPNLLVNGATGIAVGMATSIPPHNLNEVIDALAFMLERWDRLDDINVSDLMRFIKGPDLPTGGVILQDQTNDLLTAYATGKGRFIVRGNVHMEDTGRGRSRLIITELPYMANKASLIERIAELVREGNLEGISDLRDESDRQGMRVVIELSKTGEPEQVLRDLYRRTPLESTLGFNLLALVDGEPRLLSLKQALRVYLDHRLVVIRRRSEYDLGKARQRAHFLEGLRIAIANLDEVIKIIRAAPDVETARQRLIKRFKLSEIQAQAILDMPLRRLAALERKKIDEEYKQVLQTIKDLETLLKSPKKMREVVETELMQIKQTYGDRRRTQIVSLKEGETAQMLLMTTDMTPALETWVGITVDGLIARGHADDLLKATGRQAPRWLLRANTHHTLYLLTEQGQAAAVAVHALSECEKLTDGTPLARASAIDEDEVLAGLFSVPPRLNGESGERYVLTVSEQGQVKKSALADLPGPSSQCFTLSKVNTEDRLVGALLTDGTAELLLVTARGMAIRFSEQEVRPMGLVAAGVNGIKLAAGDRVVACERYQPDGEVLLLGSDGGAWRLAAAEFPLQGRYGQGVIACKPGSSSVVGLLVGKASRTATAHFEKGAPQAFKLGDVAAGKRPSAPRPLLTVKSGDVIRSVSVAIDGLSFWDPTAAIVEKKPRAARKPVQQERLPAEKSAPHKTRQVTAKTAQVPPEKPATKPAAGKAASLAEKPTRRKTAAEPEKPAATSRAKKPVEVETKPAAAPGKPAKPATTPKTPPGKSATAKPIEKPAAANKTSRSVPASAAQTPAPEAKPPRASRKKEPPADPSGLPPVGVVRESGKVVDVSSGRVKTTRKKMAEEQPGGSSTPPGGSTRTSKTSAGKPASPPKTPRGKTKPEKP